MTNSEVIRLLDGTKWENFTAMIVQGFPKFLPYAQTKCFPKLTEMIPWVPI